MLVLPFTFFWMIKFAPSINALYQLLPFVQRSTSPKLLLLKELSEPLANTSALEAVGPVQHYKCCHRYWKQSGIPRDGENTLVVGIASPGLTIRSSTPLRLIGTLECVGTQVGTRRRRW